MLQRALSSFKRKEPPEKASDAKKSSDDRSATLNAAAEKTEAAIAAAGQEKVDPKNGSSPSTHPPSVQKKKRNRDDDFDWDSSSRCLMFFPSSGHLGFETIKTSSEYPPVEILRQMIDYETQLRLSNEIQDLIEFYHHDESIITFILDLVQQHVVESFGYHDLNALRTAQHRFPDEPAVKNAFYVQHNRITQGLVKEGQPIRNVRLFTLEGRPTTLFSHVPTGAPLVLLAGSTS